MQREELKYETPFSGIKNLERADGLPVIGQGRTATVYDMGGDRVLKLFKASIPQETIRQEFERTQLAHAGGIPVPNAYEIIRSGARYGILMDRADGTVLETLIGEQPDRRRERIMQFADFVRELHRVHVQDERVPDIRETSISLAGQLDPAFCTKEEAEKIRAVFERIPSADTFLHGDCHPGNVMTEGGRMQFIDMMLCGKGHPVFDLLCMYSHYVFLPSFDSDAACLSRLGMDKAEAASLYDAFLEAYFGPAEDTGLSDIRDQIRQIHAARICLASVVMPGAFTDQILTEAKNRAVRSPQQHSEGQAR